MSDDYDTPGPGKIWGTRIVFGVLAAMAALVLTHCTLGWPA